MDAADDKTQDRFAQAIAFGPFILHRARQLLLNGQQPVRLGSRAFALLAELVEHHGQLRTRQQLEARIWPHSIVEETSLRVHMSALRRALGDGRNGARYIDNLPGCGYMFVAPVTMLGDGERAPEPGVAPLRLIGRDAELATLSSQLARRRLVSLVGPGGIGKTVLALAVAARLGERYADGVCVVDLSTVTDAQRVAQAVAQALSLATAEGASVAALCRSLAGRQMLLVLDNCEQVIEGVAGLSTALLRANAGLTLLATSREPIDAEGEWVHELAALGTPQLAEADPVRALAFPAVELFAERARAKDDRFAFDAGNAADVCTLCQHLDGIPLAIELAAGRVDSLGVTGLVASIGSLLGVLTRPRRTARPSHRTLEAMLDWSHDLLALQERIVLRRCAVFCATFSLGAAVSVCASEDLDADAVTAAVLALAAKSLLMRSEEGGVMYFRLLYLTRTYAAGRLAGSGEAAAMAARHARHVAASLDAMAAGARAAGRLSWVAMHGRSTDDIRAAIDWAFSDQGDDTLGIALAANAIHGVVWFNQLDTFGERIEQAMRRQQQSAGNDHALMTCLYSALVLHHGHTLAGSEVTGRLVAGLRALIERSASPNQRAYALYAMCSNAFGHGDYRKLKALAGELSAVARDGHDQVAAAVAQRFTAYALHYLGEHDQARELSQQLLNTALPDKMLHVWSPVPHAVSMRATLARIAWIEGHSARAALLAHEAVACAEQQHPAAICQALAMAAIPVALWRGDNVHAAQLLLRLADLVERFQLVYWRGWLRAYAGALIRRDPSMHAQLAGCIANCPEPYTVVEEDMLATVDDHAVGAAALARARDGSALWGAPEVLRAGAEQRLREGGCGAREEAEAMLAQAASLARSQHALGWELRIACTLLSCAMGGEGDAATRAALRVVLARFTEGEGTRDHRVAAALLQTGPTARTFPVIV